MCASSCGRHAPIAALATAAGPSHDLDIAREKRARPATGTAVGSLIAAILARNGHRTGTGLAFTAGRVRSARQRAGIPAAPPPDPSSELVTINQAAAELGVSLFTVRRWLRDGLLPGEQAAPSAPWRIRLTDEIRARFVPDIPVGYLSLADAAQALGCARQTVLHKVQRGELHAIHVTRGRRKGLAISVPAPTMDRLITP